MGVTALIAMCTAQVDRAVIADLVLPVAWAGAALWALMDRHLVRVGTALIATTMVSATCVLL
jgi:hypothetical protein